MTLVAIEPAGELPNLRRARGSGGLDPSSERFDGPIQVRAGLDHCEVIPKGRLRNGPE